MRTYSRLPSATPQSTSIRRAAKPDSTFLPDNSTARAILHLQSTVGNQAVLRMLRMQAQSDGLTIQRDPQPDTAKQTSPPKQKTLNDQGIGSDDPVYGKTADIIDGVLRRNQRLAPYIGDKLKAGLKVAAAGKFIREPKDGDFEDAYRNAYDMQKSDPVPSQYIGFYDPKTSEVHLRPGAKFGTALHESMHKVASPTLYKTFLPGANKISGNLAEVLKEGVTAYFTDLVLNDEGLGDLNDAYRSLKTKAENLISALGSNGPDLMAKFNFKGGAIVEIGNQLGLSTQQYVDLKSNAIAEVLKRMNKAL